MKSLRDKKIIRIQSYLSKMSRAQKAQKTVSGKTFYKKINIYHTIAV